MIKVLDALVSNKISAGEVIERPFSAVKEIVENSIDAGADRLTLEIKNGGKSYIRLSDNGCGIPENEVEIAFERHATGKISTLSDLDNIRTLGFRGEALASIAAVSRVTFYTRTADEQSGTKIVMHGGKIISREKIGMDTGTTIVIEDMFYNMPARRKFMKSDAAETGIIIDLMQKLAINYANISFNIISNGSVVLSTAGDGIRLNAIQTVYPTSDYRNLIHIESDGLEGYVSNPGVTRNTRRGQIFFVNGRIVESSDIERGIRKGYGDRVFSGYPIAIIFLTVSPSDLDVNIHPNKTEIRFLHPEEIVNKISNAISSIMCLEKSIPVSTYFKTDLNSQVLREDTVQVGIKDYLFASSHNLDNNLADEKNDVIISGKFNEPSVSGDIGNFENRTNFSSNEEERICSKGENSRIEIAPPRERLFNFSELKFAGYLFDTYIICEWNDSAYFLDQHAAHERVIYEKLIGEYNSNVKLPQDLLSPFTLDVPSNLYNGSRLWLDSLNRMGYIAEDFGNNTIIIKAIPQFMTLGEAAEFLNLYIAEFSDEQDKNNVVIDKLIMRSCKGAIKGNNHLSRQEIDDLLEKLSKCINPFSCPHGRPTFVKMTKYTIERAFKRK